MEGFLIVAPTSSCGLLKLVLQSINPSRISGDYSIFVSLFLFLKSKQKSEPQVLTHGDELILGSTTLHLHIHPGLQTCDSCEPGQIQAQVLNQAPAGGTSFDQDDEGAGHVSNQY